MTACHGAAIAIMGSNNGDKRPGRDDDRVVAVVRGQSLKLEARPAGGSGDERGISSDLIYSRDSFYRYKELCDKGGELAIYDRKTPITAAEILNDRVVPFYDEHGIRLSRVLTDRGTEFCGTQSHEYELYLAVEDIDHSRTKTKSPQTQTESASASIALS
jgi:hypothetical protein